MSVGAPETGRVGSPETGLRTSVLQKPELRTGYSAESVTSFGSPSSTCSGVSPMLAMAALGLVGMSDRTAAPSGRNFSTGE